MTALVIGSYPFPSTKAAIRGDGRVFYGETSQTTVRYRDWTNSTNTFGSEQSLPTASDSMHHVQSASAPTRDETVVAVSRQNLFSNQLYVYVWNGSTWTLGWQATIGYNASAPRFDVVYSEATGKAFVVYSKNVATTNELAFRTWDGSSWSAETAYNASRTSNIIGYVKALTRPNTDEIGVVWGDDTNMDLSANYFNAATSTWSGEPAAALSTNVSRVGSGTSINSDFVDLAFEETSGRLIVAWGDEDTAGIKYSIRTAGTAGTWGAVQTQASTTVPTDMKLASEPGTNYIAFNNAQDDDGSFVRQMEAAIWNGSAWGNFFSGASYDTSINSVGGSTTNQSMSWVKNGSQSRVAATYDDSLSSDIDWVVFNKNAGSWAVQTDVTSPTAPSNVDDYMHQMRRNPHNNSELMFLMRDWGNDLFAKKIVFDGTNINWTSVEPGGLTLETDMQDGDLNRGWGADFSYYRYTNAIDGTTSTTAITHAGTSPSTVYISDQVGYTFYTDSGGGCAYSKTTNAGTSWGAAVAVAPNSCQHIAIWYDRWTPGDTGNYIHMVTTDPTPDDLKYNRLDTTTDTLLSGGTPTAVTTTKTNTFNSDDNYPGIAKSTDGYVYIGVLDASGGSDQSYILRCNTSCSTAGNWLDTSINLPQDPDTSAKNDPLIILPQASGDMMAIINDTANDDVLSKVYHSGTSLWDASWTTIDATAAQNPTHAGSGLSAVIDRQTYDVYLAYVTDASSPGTNDDIRTARYTGGSWVAGSDVVTNDTKGIITAQLSFNENNKDVYVAYIAQTTAGTTTSANVFWKKSVGGLASWGTEQGPMNAINGEVYGLRLSPSSNERVFATWTSSATTSSSPRVLFGDSLTDFTPPVYTQSAYRVYNNTNTADVGSALASQDTAPTVSTGQAFRIRLLLHSVGDEARVGLDSFKLQYAGKGSGTCAAPSGGTPSSYTDVTAATSIAYKDNAAVTDGATLTANANDPTHSGHTIRNQTYEEANPFTNSLAAIASNEDGKWDFSLFDNGATGATSYCFRAVKNDGTVLGTYSQYPEIALQATNQSPNSPTSLAQLKTDNSPIATAAWSNDGSVKFSALASDPDASDTLQLCVEKKPLGTAFDSNSGAETCGSGVAYSGSPVTTTVTISGHTDGQYHWQARVKDASSGYSSWVSFAQSTRSIAAKWEGDGLTNGTVMSTSTAGVGDNAFNNVSGSGGNATVSTTGSHSPRIQFPSLSSQAKFLNWSSATIGSRTNYAVRTYFELDDIGSLSSTIFRFNNVGSEIWRVDVAGTGGAPPGEIRLRGAAGALLDDSGTIGLAPDTTYRLEAVVSSGTVTLTFYQGESTTPIDTLTGSVGTTVDALDIGPSGTTTSAIQYFDNIAFDNSASAIGPAHDYGIDTTAPTGGTVYDGITVGVDAAFNNGSLSDLSANWAGFNTNVSGLQRYEYSIGTTAGGTNVRNWTNNGTATSVTATGLSLQTSQQYFVNVRAVDAAGNTQTAVSSDGQLILPSLSFGTSSNTVNFDNLNSSNNFTNTKTTTLTTSTNAYGGYAIRAFASGDLQSGANTIPAFVGGTYTFPDSWQSGDTGFGYTSNDPLVQGSNKFQNDPCPGGSALAAPGCFAPFSQTKPGDIVADHTANVVGTPLVNQEFIITYRVTTPSSQAARTYSTNIVYSVLPIY